MTDRLATLTRSYDAFRALGLPHTRALEAAQAVLAVLSQPDATPAPYRPLARLQ